MASSSTHRYHPARILAYTDIHQYCWVLLHARKNHAKANCSNKGRVVDLFDVWDLVAMCRGMQWQEEEKKENSWAVTFVICCCDLEEVNKLDSFDHDQHYLVKSPPGSLDKIKRLRALKGSFRSSQAPKSKTVSRTGTRQKKAQQLRPLWRVCCFEVLFLPRDLTQPTALQERRAHHRTKLISDVNRRSIPEWGRILTLETNISLVLHILYLHRSHAYFSHPFIVSLIVLFSWLLLTHTFGLSPF